jgi:hypothetical protein
MNREREAIQDSLVLGASIGLGITALLMLVAGCSPEAESAAITKGRSTHLVPPPLPQSVVVEFQPSARAAAMTTIAPPDGFSSDSPSPSYIPASQPVLKRGSARLGWKHSPAAAGYVINYGTNSYEYLWQATLGLVTNATVTGLEEGCRYYFAINSIGTNGMFGSLSPEISGVTPIYVNIQQERWSVSSFGVIGSTNKMQQSTNLNDWWTVLEWIGTGAATNHLHTNTAQAWFRVR